MSDLISRSALFEKLVKRFRHIDRGRSWNNEHMPIYDAIRLDEIENLKYITLDIEPVDAAPVVHARNVTPTHPSDEFVCGNCGFCCEITEIRHDDEDDFGLGEASAHEYECKFCPECGAKMDGKEDGK